MNQADLLNEFEGKIVRTPLFKISIAIFACLFITHVILLQLFNFEHSFYEVANTLKLILQFLFLFAYPVFGGWAFYRIKKVGWFMCAHYALTSFFFSAYFLIYNTSILTGISVLLSLMTIILIFQTSLTKFFDVSHNMIFAVLITTIAAPFVLFAIMFALLN